MAATWYLKMAQVPSNLIPTRITQLPESPTASAEGYLIFVYEGRTYKIRAGYGH